MTNCCGPRRARLATTLRDADTLGRMGGDEFVVLVDGDGLAAPELVAERILDVMRRPFDLAGATRPISVSASIGIACGDRPNAGDMLRDADIALYRGPQLAIQFRAGTIAIATADVTETTVDLQPRHDSQGARDLVAATTIEQHGNEIAVVVPKRFGNLLGRSTDLALTVSAPHDTALAIGSGSADIVATGRYTTSTVTTGSGDIDLDELTDSADVRSGSGAIRVRSVAGDLKVVDGSGDVEVGSVDRVGVGADRVRRRHRGQRRGRAGGQVGLRRRVRRVGARRPAHPHRLRRHRHRRRGRRRGAGQGGVGRHQGRVSARARRPGSTCARSAAGSSSGLDAGPAPEVDERQARLQLETVSGDIRLVRV